MELELPDGRRIPSFALAVASLYLEREGEQPPERPPTDSRGFWYLDFAGQPGDYYEYISVADLLDKSVPAEYFADRIVLIGPYAAGLQDQYITSANHAQPMYGVEIQANAVQALLEENYKQEAPRACAGRRPIWPQWLFCRPPVPVQRLALLYRALGASVRRLSVGGKGGL